VATKEFGDVCYVATVLAPLYDHVELRGPPLTMLLTQGGISNVPHDVPFKELDFLR
jgi:hypothetical protein